jgi:hypothetical protein
MTPEERAEKLTNKVLHMNSESFNFTKTEKVILKAIKQAIQEERAACAKIADREVESLEQCADMAVPNQKFTYAAGIISEIAQAIRSRGEK